MCPLLGWIPTRLFCAALLPQHGDDGGSGGACKIRRAWPFSALAPVVPQVPASAAVLMGCPIAVPLSPQDFHYRPKGSDTCLPCDCYPVGSTSRSCDKETGRCHCRPGVIGRQCNSCDSPFAEVTPSGCEGECGHGGELVPWGLASVASPCDRPLGVCVSTVLYDGCPKSLKAGVWWPQTKFGFSAAVLCPKGSLGEWGM